MPNIQANGRSRLLELPGEIREQIYRDVLCPQANEKQLEDGYRKYNFDLSLLLVSKQVYHEALEIFRKVNVFVSVESPWSEAESHVAIEGYVPLVMRGDKAERFKWQHLTVTIDAPQYRTLGQVLRKFVILLDDLPKFTEMWFYSDLTHLGLNYHLRLTLKVQNPYSSSLDPRPVPKWLQKELLLPFGRVKELREVVVQGDHYESIEKAMREEMATPYVSAEACCEEATRLKDEGNAALQSGKYREAIKLYTDSFRAIHIIVSGRRRSIWGDSFFQRPLSGGMFDGQHGQLVRLVLRVRLVANIVLAYLKLEEYEEAQFWGLRSINMMRTAVDGDEAMLDFAAAKEMGKIYYRTGLACKALGDAVQARQLIRVATLYLPNDNIVAQEWRVLDAQNPTPRIG